MNVIESSTPSKEALATLEPLTSSVAMALDKKRKLGQYAIVWDGTKPVKLTFENTQNK